MSPQDAPFEFYDPTAPIYTSARFLPPAKIISSQVGEIEAAAPGFCFGWGLL